MLAVLIKRVTLICAIAYAFVAVVFVIEPRTLQYHTLKALPEIDPVSQERADIGLWQIASDYATTENGRFRDKNLKDGGGRGMLWEDRGHNYHPFSDMFCPPPPGPRSLVFITAGRSGMENVNTLIVSWGMKTFDYVLLHYDDSSSEWKRFNWYDRVVSITAQRQMKLWFYKRFGSPWLVKGYRYVHFVDSDVGSPPNHSFDLATYERILQEHGVLIAQPAVLRGGRSSDHDISRAHPGSLFRWTSFVENGPLFSVAQRAYSCFWGMINPDLVTGWGVDLGWCQYAAQVCGYPEHRTCAVVDAQFVIHLDKREASSHFYRNTTFEQHGRREMEVYRKFLSESGVKRFQTFNVYETVGVEGG